MLKKLFLKKLFIFIAISSSLLSHTLFATKVAELWKYCQTSDIIRKQIKASEHKIICIALSNDSKYIAVGTVDKKINIYTYSGQFVVAFQSRFNPHSLAFSENSKELAIGYSKGSITIINLENLEDVREYSTQQLESESYSISELSLIGTQLIYSIKVARASNISSSCFMKIVFDLDGNRVESKQPYTKFTSNKLIFSIDKSLKVELLKKFINGSDKQNISLTMLVGIDLNTKILPNYDGLSTCLALNALGDSIGVGFNDGMVLIYKVPESSSLFKSKIFQEEKNESGLETTEDVEIICHK